MLAIQSRFECGCLIETGANDWRPRHAQCPDPDCFVKREISRLYWELNAPSPSVYNEALAARLTDSEPGEVEQRILREETELLSEESPFG